MERSSDAAARRRRNEPGNAVASRARYNEGLMKKSIVSLAALCAAIALASVHAQQSSPPAQTPPPAPARATCTRASLQAAVESYLAAQKSGDSKKMTFADKVKYLENM